MSEQQQTSPVYFTSAEASQYLKDAHGQTISAHTLAKWRCVGGGPQFYPNNGRPRYAPSDLDRFAIARLGKPVHSTSEYVEHAA